MSGTAQQLPWWRYVTAAALVIFGTAAIALYPTIMAVCMIPGWRTFIEAFAMSYVFVLILGAAIVLAVTRGE